MCHLLFYSLSIYIKWSLLRISKIFVLVLFLLVFLLLFDLFSVHWLPTQTLSFPRRRTSVRIVVCSLNLLCSNKDVLYRLCFRRRQNYVTLENLWRLYGVLCVLDCIVENVPWLMFFLSPLKCCSAGWQCYGIWKVLAQKKIFNV